jgi:hypothetical protein
MDSGEGLARQVGPVALWVLALVLSLANLYPHRVGTFSPGGQPWRFERYLFGPRRRR